MKHCAFCGEPMADVALHCPSCGVAKGSPPGTYHAPHDEPLGFSYDGWVLKAILATLALLLVAGLLWFVR